MRSIDLNADLGEYSTLKQQACERNVLAYVTSCNIACGGHAGDEQTIGETIAAAQQASVNIGAHPSYPDKEGFGRRKLDITVDELKDSILSQLSLFKKLADKSHARITHVKPHGMLYTEAMNSSELATLISSATHEVLGEIAIMGMPNTVFEQCVLQSGSKFIREAFIDRKYMDDGRLKPRFEEGAVLETLEARLWQAKSIAQDGVALSDTGKEISLEVDTLCLHGDSTNAVETARQVRDMLVQTGLTLSAPGR